jgi:hypothetical protein
VSVPVPAVARKPLVRRVTQMPQPIVTMSNGGEYDVEGVTTSPVTETHIHKPIAYYKRADGSFYTRDTTGKCTLSSFSKLLT